MLILAWMLGMPVAALSAQHDPPRRERSGWFEVRYERIESVAGKETVVRGTMVIDPVGRQRDETGPDWSRPDEGWVADTKAVVYIDASRALPSRALRWIRRLFGLNPEIVLGRIPIEAPAHMIAADEEVEHSFALTRPPQDESNSSLSVKVEYLGQREVAGVVCQGVRASRRGGDFSEQWLVPADHPLARSVSDFYSETMFGDRRTFFRVMRVTQIEPRPHLFAVLAQ